MGIDVVDEAPLRFALAFEADVCGALRFGVDVDNTEINSPLPGARRSP